VHVRVRAAVLVPDGDSILLVKHVHPVTGDQWWVPPGGRLEDRDASIVECAQREVFEETGLQVSLGRPVYFREFHDVGVDVRYLEVFFLCAGFHGDLTLDNVAGNGPDDNFIQEVAWVSKERIGELRVYPTELKDVFWQDRSEGFPQARFLGVHRG